MSSETFSTPPPALDRPTRPLYWSIRRELWENRAIAIALMIVSAIVLLSFAVGTYRLPDHVRAVMDGTKSAGSLFKPFGFGASAILLTGFILGAFHSIDALYGERRDRSILFWKSLPVSDRTTVLSKALIPIVVLPLLCYAIALTVQIVMFIMATIILTLNGFNPAAFWTRVPLASSAVTMLYGTTAHALWFAPLYAWLLLVSAWAKRAPLVWTVLPAIVIGIIERIALNTEYFRSLLRYRLTGALYEAFIVDPKTGIAQTSRANPSNFLTTPGLWLGLLFAAVCIAIAIRLRRHRDPI